MTRRARHRAHHGGRLFARAGATAVATLLACPLSVLPALAEDVDFTLPSASGISMSGLTADADAMVYWMVTDPAKATVMSVKADGTVAGRLVLNAKVASVQALSWVSGVLYVGDIGGKRDEVTVLTVGDPTNGLATPQSYRLRYPDGAHDAGALMVSPRGNLYLVTKGDDPAFYRPTEAPTNGAVVSLRRVASAPAGVTDGTFLSDGERLALRTPVGIQVYDAFTFRQQALGPSPDQVPGDALSESLDGGRLVVGYGGALPRVSVMDYPTGVVTSSPRPSPPVSSPASGSGSPSASGSGASPSAAPATAPPSAAAGSRGTLLAIGVAALVSALAGAVTLISRRR